MPDDVMDDCCPPLVYLIEYGAASLIHGCRNSYRNSALVWTTVWSHALHKTQRLDVMVKKRMCLDLPLTRTLSVFGFQGERPDCGHP